MNRSPLFYPLNRGGDGEAGGAADLQTDVMRFMAILSLCLVAIFALVQSIPPDEIRRPEPPDDIPPPKAVEMPLARTIVAAPAADALHPQLREEQPEPVAEPVPEQRAIIDADEIDLQFPAAPARVATSTPAGVQPPMEEPARESPKEDAVVEEAVVNEAPAKPVEGFSLRFEDDLALTRLVARNEVGMYAIADDKSMRMNINRGDIGFWSASTPKQFHEMESSTVPRLVLDAYRHSGDGKSVKWGVTLPPGMTRQLNQYLNEHSGGSIVIEGDGGMRLEQ